MSNIEQIDFSTLIWVKQELDETLKRAQDALEEYVENPEDENQLQFCATYLHQVQGTLKMVELYGAAMVAEEMEQVVKKIIAKEVDSEKDSFEVLMRGIILLPDYLERIQLGYKDIPMVLLPLVNDLRTVKGDQLLSESALFNPDLSLGMPESKFSSSFTLSPNQLNQVVHKIRSAYQVCFLNWLKDIDVEANLKKIQIIVDKLKTVITPIDEKQLFWVAGGLFEALISGGLEKSVTVKQLAARLDQAIRMLTTPDTTEDRCYKKLTNNLLYYVALADSKDRRVKEIQTFFRLSDFISDDKEIEHAQSSLSGKNRELLESVTNVIKEDLMTIQESLDLYNRNEHGSVADLESFVSSFSKISDTLGIIGIGVARSKIRKDIELLEENIKNDTVLDADTIMHVAETLLFVESALDENILLLGAIKDKFPAEESLIPAAEMKTIMDTLAKESIQNLQRIKQNFVQYMEAPWNKESIKLSPKLLREISGALKMSGYEDVAIEIDKIEQYTSKYMLESDHKPTVDQLDLLAESIASLEYYLEYLSDGIKGEERILDLARSNITLLFETVEKTEKQRQHTQNLDSNLDQMSDDDFDMSDLDDGLSESDSDAGIGYDELLEDSDNIDDLDVEKEEAELIVAFSNDTDDDIKEVFLEEFEEELEHLNSIFPIWKDDFDTQVELLGEIRRIYHTFKGSGRLVGAFAIGDYSWRIEEMINPVLNETHTVNESFLQVMQRSTDILPGLLDALKNETVVPPGYHAVIAAAEKVANGETLQDGIFIETKTEVEAEAEETGELQSDIPAADEDTIHPDNQSDTDESQISVADTDLDTVTTDVEQTDTDDLSVDPVFVEILQQEVEGHLSEITEFLQNIKETGNHNSTEQFIRVIHTLNGAANMASVNSIVEMTAPLELAAKLSHELNIDLDTESVDKISQFREQAFNIMKDLSNNSESSLLTAGIGAYFKGLFEKLDAEKSAAKLIYSEEGSGMDFDLSQFIDEADSSENTGSDIDTTEETELTEYTIDDINVEEDKIIKDESIEYSESAGKTDLSDIDFDLEITSIEDETVEDSTDSEDIESFTIDDISFEGDGSEQILEDTTREMETADEEFIQEDTIEETDSEDVLEENPAIGESDITESSDEDSLDEKAVEETLIKEDFTEEESSKTDDEPIEYKIVEDSTETEDTDNLEQVAENSTLETTDEEFIKEDTTVEETDSEEVLEQDFTEEESIEDDSQEQDTTKWIYSKNETDFKHVEATVTTDYDQPDISESHEQTSQFDEELLEIFKEEADDILDRTEHVLSELEADPENTSLILALQRDLHTLKGGARMAGLENIGELGHVLESLLEIIGEENRTVDKTIIDTMHESFDLLNQMKEKQDFGQSMDISVTLNKVKHLVGFEGDVIPEESKLDLDYFAPIDPMVASDAEADVEVSTEVIQPKKKSNILSGNQIKVNSELLDNLVNYAGEVSIYRSRLEQEVGSFRVNLLELGNTVARIREQLRKLDAETEAQIISTFQTEADDDEGFDPLEMDRFSQLQQLSRSLTESVSDLTSIHSYLDDVARTSDNLLSQQSRVNTELQEGLMETRLVSFNSIVPRLRRLVRTTSQELDKPVKIEVQGAEGEMDKTVLEGVIAPLEHMLRNSLAHGIEANRSKTGKPEQGSIIIDVRREATEVVISIIDDGAGIDRKKVRKLALDKGLIKKGAHLTDEAIDRLILHSGFTTVEEVSKLAGRGVGMDVVSNQINLLGGSLDISSEPKVGTKFSIRLPYTLALSSALLVEISEAVYALPVSGLEGVIRMSYADYLQKIKDQDFTYEYANEEYQLQELNKLLDIDSEVVVENNQIPLVMIRSGERGVALRVDKIIGSREIVVKTVGSQISSVPGIYGATILGDGNVVLILDIIPLSRAYLQKLENLDESVQLIEQEEVEKDPIVMIVDDSITMRKVGERILRRNDYDVLTAKDGLDALDLLKETIPDIMLLDIEMPRMDGYELAIEMKKENKYADIPIIMITSRTGEKHRQKAMDLGVDRYLGKPYQEADLLQNIRDLIEDSNE